jgi:hypothetical protein
LEEINKQGAKAERVVKCLLQIFIAQEETKFGLSYEECREFLVSDRLKSLHNVSIQGLMGMGSLTANNKQLEQEYGQLNAFFEELKLNHPHLNTLSCGMSGDYQLAIGQGSNMVRIGSSIFGEREYKEKG